MVSFTPVQWLQTIISNCMQMISIENDRKLSAINPKDLKKIYESYSEAGISLLTFLSMHFYK